MPRTRTRRTTTSTQGRRGAVAAASAAVVCLGAALAACSGGGRDGYVAVGGVPRPAGTAGGPTGAVRMVPLDGRDGSTKSPSAQASSDRPRTRTPAAGTAPGPAGTASDPVGTAPDPAGSPEPVPGSTPSATGQSPSAPQRPSPTPTPPHTTPAAPADLGWGDPTRKETDRRWCEKVTVAFHNSGGTAVRSGTVTFGTHIIGGLGIDWGTVASTVDLPVPLAAGAHESPTWTVCVDAWRVPLGMHIETRDVAVRWSQ
ncbi:hypothetical protein ACFZCP_24440 [Streptomyces sp. NPDC007971]|uniref:hypothetical protein n=1 Tax=Streptomyces sp. NPDC007971 TaxID=3364799 RepID=UPI0036E7D5E2